MFARYLTSVISIPWNKETPESHSGQEIYRSMWRLKVLVLDEVDLSCEMM